MRPLVRCSFMKIESVPGFNFVRANQLLFLLLVLVLAPSSRSAPAVTHTAPRERTSFDSDWRFIKGDPEGVGTTLSYANIKPWFMMSGAEYSTRAPSAKPEGEPPGGDVSYAQPAFDDGSWRKLNLPHDWGIEGPFKQEYPGETGKLPWWGVAWYRKHFNVSALDQDRRISIEVDGAMAYASVWLNGKYVGGWPYGYASWRLDLTPFIKFGGENVLAIRLDNPPDSSRWYPGGGIYRNVWLVKTSPVHVSHWGTYVTTPEVSEVSATVKISVNVDNDSVKDATASVLNEVYELNADGTRGRFNGSFDIAGVAIASRSTREAGGQITLRAPRLWSTQKPQRYVVVTSI